MALLQSQETVMANHLVATRCHYCYQETAMILHLFTTCGHILGSFTKPGNSHGQSFSHHKLPRPPLLLSIETAMILHLFTTCGNIHGTFTKPGNSHGQSFSRNTVPLLLSRDSHDPSFIHHMWSHPWHFYKARKQSWPII